ncbi:MAG: 6-phospho-beta-glucosidase [Blastocatellia bacterium]|jgi:6-phospho-beta-glucosidase
MSKVTILGGGGIRTPLLIHGLVRADFGSPGLAEISLYDIDHVRAAMMAALGREVVRQAGASVVISTPETIEEAVTGAEFVVSSLRVGGSEARSRDERIAIEHGIAGQETTGLGGLSKALRTIPVMLEHARAVERYAPEAWFISFTNPAGLMTQALSSLTRLKLIGICDTPSEMFHRLAESIGRPVAEVGCDYFGLNHLGWIRRVVIDGEDCLPELLGDDRVLRSLYHADLFDPEMIRGLGMLPSEYLFFYYEQQRALRNQQKTGASRGAEVARLNETLFGELYRSIEESQMERALGQYREYLQRRSGSYMKLEAEGGTALGTGVELAEDPFEAATGYHRIAIDVMTALRRSEPTQIVLNVANRGAIEDLAADDVVELPCLIDRHGPRPIESGRLPESVRGLILSVKEYERLTIRAAVEGSSQLAKMALLVYPLVGQWRPASEMIEALISQDPEHLGYLR